MAVTFEQAASLAAKKITDSIRKDCGGQELTDEEREAAILAEEEYELSQNTKPDSIRSRIKGLWKENKLAVFSAAVIVVFILLILFADWIMPYDPNEVNLLARTKAPSREHWFGTDELGRDVLSRVLDGGKVSLMVGVIPTTISMVVGIVMGLLAGYVRRLDPIIMRLADIVLAFPSIVLAMVVMYTLGASTFNIFIALSMISWAGTARIVRSQTLSLREMEYVEAAKGMGVGKWSIMFRHILPNCLPSLIVLYTMGIPDAILSEASLSFLGVGAQPPDSSWGLMASQAKSYAMNCPWMLIFPSLAILIMVLALNFLGDGLRDALDPHLKK